MAVVTGDSDSHCLMSFFSVNNGGIFLLEGRIIKNLQPSQIQLLTRKATFTVTVTQLTCAVVDISLVLHLKAIFQDSGEH